MTERVCIKLLNVHYRCEILAREPTLAFATVGFANVAGVTSRSIAASAIVDEQTVGVKCLFKRDVYKFAVGCHRYADRRAVMRPCVNDPKKCDLLPPNFNHRFVERCNVFAAFFDAVFPLK